MKIPSIKNKDYVTVWGKIPEENADFGYLLKKCTSAEAADSVELWYGEKDSWVFCNKDVGRKLLHDCYPVQHTLNGVARFAIFEEFEEAMDYTMKVIALIKA